MKYIESQLKKFDEIVEEWKEPEFSFERHETLIKYMSKVITLQRNLLKESLENISKLGANENNAIHSRISSIMTDFDKVFGESNPEDCSANIDHKMKHRSFLETSLDSLIKNIKNDIDKFDTIGWLRNVYGLTDGGNRNSGEVSYLVETFKYDIIRMVNIKD